MAVMAFESWLDPTTTNSIGATGLIQFLPSTAKELGTTTDALRKMSAVEQLDYVYGYLKPVSGKMKTVGDIYASILFGKYSGVIGKPDSHPVWKKGSNEYRDNAPLDINKDGVITKGEATKKVTDRRDTYKKSNNKYEG